MSIICFVTATVLHVHKDLIIIQKLIILHTHTVTDQLLFTESPALGLAILLHSDRYFLGYPARSALLCVIGCIALRGSAGDQQLKCCLQNQQQQADSRQSAVVVQLQQAAAVAGSWLQPGKAAAVTTAAERAAPAGGSSSITAEMLLQHFCNSIIIKETHSNLIFLLF